MRVVLILGALLSAARPAPAQDTTVSPYPPRGAHSSAVGARYDARHDKTVLTLSPLALDSAIAVSVLVALDGREMPRTPADGVVLTFWSTASGKRFEPNRSISVSINDARPDSLGSGWLVPKPAPGYTEVMMRSVPLAMWLRIANANKLTLNVAGYAYAVAPELLGAIRDFASRMAPGATAGP